MQVASPKGAAALAGAETQPGGAGQFNGTSKKQALHALQFLYLNTLSIIPQLLRL